MPDRLLYQPLLCIPRAHSLVEYCNFIFMDAFPQLLLQQLLEHVMQAIPHLAIIEGDEYIRALQPIQGRLYLIVREIAAKNR